MHLSQYLENLLYLNLVTRDDDLGKNEKSF